MSHVSENKMHLNDALLEWGLLPTRIRKLDEREPEQESLRQSNTLLAFGMKKH